VLSYEWRVVGNVHGGGGPLMGRSPAPADSNSGRRSFGRLRPHFPAQRKRPPCGPVADFCSYPRTTEPRHVMACEAEVVHAGAGVRITLAYVQACTICILHYCVTHRDEKRLRA